MHACIHTYIYTYIHIYIRSYIHIYVHTYIHAYIHTLYIHTHIRTYIYIQTYIVHTYIYTNVHTYIHTYIVRDAARRQIFFNNATHTVHVRGLPNKIRLLASSPPLVLSSTLHRQENHCVIVSRNAKERPVIHCDTER
jgi:hypothetical protein